MKILITGGTGFIGKKLCRFLLDSRINTTKQLIDYIERADKKPEVLISGSAVG